MTLQGEGGLTSGCRADSIHSSKDKKIFDSLCVSHQLDSCIFWRETKVTLYI